MKKLLSALTFAIIALSTISPASAATWTAAVNNAISSGNLESINQIVAKSPSDAGAIAVYLLQQAKANTGDPGKAVALFNAAVPFSAQIAPKEVKGAASDIKGLVKLANDPGFQKNHTSDAAHIYSDALNVLSLPNFSKTDPALHGAVIADAGEFLDAYPDADKELKDEVLLAQGMDLNGVNPDLIVVRIREQHQQTAEVTPPVVTPPVTPPEPPHRHWHHHPSED